MPEPDLKKLRQETQGWRPRRESGGGAFWWIVGTLVVLWLFNGGPR
jgi:hypothetical protein